MKAHGELRSCCFLISFFLECPVGDSPEERGVGRMIIIE